MLRVAERRFSGKSNVSFRVSDYTAELPDVPFDTVISALSIHHLEDDAKEKLFAEIYRRLPEDGIFVNYDQFCAGTPQLDEWYDRYWESQLAASGLSQKDIGSWQERRRLDRECSVEQECEMLRRCGFQTVKCIYSYQKFAVIIAIPAPRRGEQTGNDAV